MNWVQISHSELPEEGGIRKITLDGRQVCLIREEGHLYASAARCPHAGADLSGGWCETGRLICPYHRHAFDLKTGKGDAGQGNYISVYPVEYRNGGWFVGIKKRWWVRLFRK